MLLIGALAGAVTGRSLAGNVAFDRAGYFPGDVIQGTVTLFAEGMYSQFTITLTGIGECHWTSGTGDDETTYRASKEYLRLITTVGQHEGISFADGREMRYPFSLQLPNNLPPSLFYNIHNHINYKVTVAPTQGSFTTLSAPFTVLSNGSVMQESVRVDQHNEFNKKCFCIPCASFSSMRASIELDRSVFALGEEIQVKVCVNSEWEDFASNIVGVTVVLREKFIKKANSSFDTRRQDISYSALLPNSDSMSSFQGSILVPGHAQPSFIGYGGDPLTLCYNVKAIIMVKMPSFTPGFCNASSFALKVPILVVSALSMQQQHYTSPTAMVMKTRLEGVVQGHPVDNDAPTITAAPRLEAPQGPAVGHVVSVSMPPAVGHVVSISMPSASSHGGYAIVPEKDEAQLGDAEHGEENAM